MLFHPEFYKTGVAYAGCYENRMDKIVWNEAGMGGPLDESYSASSGVDNAWRLKGHLLMVVGELAQSVANGESDLGLDEAALVFASRFAGIVTDRTRQTIVAQVRERARAVDSAAWIEAHSTEGIDLARVARRSGLSPFHFLRVFAQVLSMSPRTPGGLTASSATRAACASSTPQPTASGASTPPWLMCWIEGR